MWDAKRNQFVHVRHKWGSVFSEAIPHVEEDTTYDVFVAWYVAGKDEQKLIDELKKHLPEYEGWMKKLGK